MQKIRFGIISSAKIGVEQVIPAMQNGEYCEVVALASRNIDKATEVCAKLGIPKVYGSYEELLADPDVDAIYNPLPNHLHVPWAIKSLEAGKHVLCEKPLALSSGEAEELLATSKKYPDLKITEAFMYRHHPQWKKAKELVETGGIGTLRTIQSFFSYYNDDGGNIRNMAEIGGGGMMDIGCYCLSLSRYIFGKEPKRVCGMTDIHPEFKTDIMFSGMLDFGDGSATFSCSTQLAPYQRVNILGTTGRIEILIPFNAPIDQKCIVIHQSGDTEKRYEFDICDQYTLQGDSLAKAIMDDTDVLTPLEDGHANMVLLEKCVLSASENKWLSI